MADDLIQKIETHLTDMKTDRSYWEPVWQDVADYINPRREGFWQKDGDRPIGRSVTRYDSTPEQALRTMADGMSGQTVSPAQPWFSLRYEDENDQKDYQKVRWLEECQKRIYAAFNKSNFYQAINEVFADAASLATSYLFADEDIAAGKIRFIAVHPAECYISEDEQERVDCVIRRYQMRKSQVKNRWPDSYPKEWGEDNAKVYVVHAVFRADEHRFGKWSNPKGYAVRSVYYTKEADTVLEDKGFYEWPYAVWRWSKNSSETYGRGPGIWTLPDVLMLNQIAKGTLQAIQLQVEPRWVASESLKGKQINLKPNGITYTRNGPADFQRADQPINFSAGLTELADKRQQIKTAFMVDMFLMLAMATQQMTAQEVLERQNEKASIIGAVLARCQSELIDPMIERVFGIEMRAGRLPAPPEGMQNLRIRCDMLGPLAVAQKRAQQATGMAQGLGQIVPLAQLDPGVMDLVNFDKVAREYADAYNVPRSVLRTETEVDGLRQAKQQAQAAQMQQMAQMQQAEAYQKTRQAPEQGSPAQAMTGGPNG